MADFPPDTPYSQAMNDLEIVYFDAGNTLLTAEPGIGESYASAGARHGIAVTTEEIEASFVEVFSRQRTTTAVQGEDWWREIVVQVFAPFGEAPPALFDDLYEHFSQPESFRLFPTALETLDAVAARGLRVGMISNWDERLHRLIEGLGIRDRLDPVIASYEVGFEKPDRRIFEAAVAASGVAPERSLLIGDEPVMDVEGAIAIGMKAVLVDRRDRHPSITPRVRSLRDLIDLI